MNNIKSTHHAPEKWDAKIRSFEEDYFFDTLQERKLALRDFAREIEKECEKDTESVVKGCGKSYNNEYDIPKWCGEEGLCPKCVSQDLSEEGAGK